MSSPVPCTSCSTVLVPHCPSPTCHWLRCTNGECEWRTYDLGLGSRINLDGTVERIASG